MNVTAIKSPLNKWYHSRGYLNLDGLTSLSDAAAESLSKHEGTLNLDGLTSLSDAAAESLSKHQGQVTTAMEDIRKTLTPAQLAVGDPIENSIGMVLVPIPAGEFVMGSPESEEDRGESETQHRVTLTKSFHLGEPW